VLAATDDREGLVELLRCDEIAAVGE